MSYYSKHKEQERVRHAAWWAAHPEKKKEYAVRRRAMRKKEDLAYNVARGFALKLGAFNAYGGPKCSRCGFNDARALDIDHIDGGGTKHRREVGSAFYRNLRDSGYPPGYQVLCRNCNWIKHMENLGHTEPEVVLSSDDVGTTHEDNYAADGYPYPRPARWIRTSPLNPDMADMADPPDEEDR